MANSVTISGSLTRIKTGESAKGPWAFGVIQPEGEPGRFDFSAFDDVAGQLSSLTEGQALEIRGQLWRKQDKKTEQWQTIVKVHELEIL